tara:strand:- start:15752 stop:18010 length:2259 start_codon:yes stop_codon:yes gene_type:complete
MKKQVRNFRNLNLLIMLYLLVLTSVAKAEIFNDIKISGNQRLSIETVIMFSDLATNVDLSKEDLNISIKKLYETNYFKDVKIEIKNKTLEIKVEENPIIQSIKIEGIKNKEIEKNLYDLTKKSEKYPFLNDQIKDQKNLLLNVVRSTGFYFAKIETIVLDNSNNSVDIIYSFDLGKRAVIKKIKFQGNKIFKDSKLRNIIKSEEGSFWKFITSNKYLNERKILNDEELLKKYYQNKGYFNVNIKSSYAKNIDNEFFELIFNIDAGNKYFFNDINLELNTDFDKDNFENIINKTKKLKGKKYSPKKLDKIVEEIDKIVLQKEYLFLNTKFDLVIKEKDKIDINLKFQDLEKFYVERINIFGNFVTEEKVIRNSLIIDEGDAFNEVLFEKSINNIKSRGIFKSVKSSVKTSDSDNQKKIIDIKVQETPTGEIFAGAGTGTSGSSISAGIQEKNYLGKGIKLSTNISVSEDQLKGKLSILNPNFRNTDRSLNTTIESTSSDFLSTGGFKTSRTGFGIGTGFEQYSDFFVNFDVSAYYEKLETSSDASAYKKKQEGDYLENLFTYNLSLNKLDQNFQPTDGYRVSFKQVLPIYSDDLSIGNTLNLSKYHSLSDNLILSGKLFFKAINSIDDDVRVSKRVYIPSSKLRGFEAGKFGPKDGTEYVGGNFGTAVNLDTTLPNVFSGYENIDLSLFLDAASLREVDYDSSLESSDIRSSTGISVNWYTVVGPLSFSYAIPLASEPSDKTESFRFRIGTSF